jgi:4-amino-4-deoxy-L-arabinose transferase-like glycosyltransferase
MKSAHARITIAAVLALAFAARLAFGLYYWVGKPLTLDEQEYLLLATSLATGGGFTYPQPGPGEPARHFERPPGFAFLLAGVLLATGDPLVGGQARAPFPLSSSDVPVAIKIAQSLVGTLGVLVIAAIARHTAGDRAAAIAAGIAAIYPPLVWTCAYVLAEPLYSLLALGAVWLLVRSVAPAPSGVSTLLATVLAGVLAGAALLTKEAMLFFLVLAVPWLVVRKQPLAAIALFAGALAIVTPWVVRNHAVHGRFVLTAAHGGVTLWTGNNPLARGEGDLAANPDMGRARVAFEASHPDLDNQQLDALYYRQAIEFVTSRPLQWLWLEARKLFYLFVPIGPSYRLHSTRYYLATLASYLILMPFAVAGAWRLARTRDAGRLWPLWLMAASIVVVSLVFFPQERFRIPVMDPLAIVFAAALSRR